MEYQAEAKVLDWGNTKTSVFSSASVSTLRKNEATALLPSMRVLPDLNNLSEYSFNTIILQRSLNLIFGSNLTLDGKYDIETTDAVAAYQVASGISGFVSGAFGSATRNSLIDKLVLIQSGLG
jgi:peptidoglycan hydrolase-like protein with peptidoglycan-binding domain